MADEATLEIKLTDTTVDRPGGPPRGPGGGGAGGGGSGSGKPPPIPNYALPIIGAKAVDPAVQAAAEQIEREQLARRTEMARRGIDAEFKQRRETEEKLAARRAE